MEVRGAGIIKPRASDLTSRPAHSTDKETEAQKNWEPQSCGAEVAAPSAPRAASQSTAGSGIWAPAGRQRKRRGPPLCRSCTRPSDTGRARLPGRSAPSLPAPRAHSPPAADAGRSGEAAPAASWPQPCPRPPACRFTCTPPSVPARHFPCALRPRAPHFRLLLRPPRGTPGNVVLSPKVAGPASAGESGGGGMGGNETAYWRGGQASIRTRPLGRLRLEYLPLKSFRLAP